MNSVRKQTIDEFIKGLSSSSPTPGGGAAAALSGALAASLVKMVASLTIGKKGYKKVVSSMQQVVGEVEKHKRRLLELADEDVRVFNKVVKVYKLPETDKSRERKIQEALKKATEVPLETALLSNEVLHLAKEVSERGNKNAISDAKSAQYLAQAATLSALENVAINLEVINEPTFIKKVNTAIARLK